MYCTCIYLPVHSLFINLQASPCKRWPSSGRCSSSPPLAAPRPPLARPSSCVPPRWSTTGNRSSRSGAWRCQLFEPSTFVNSATGCLQVISSIPLPLFCNHVVVVFVQAGRHAVRPPGCERAGRRGQDKGERVRARQGARADNKLRDAAQARRGADVRRRRRTHWAAGVRRGTPA